MRSWGTASRGQQSLSTLLDLATAYHGPEVVFDVQDARFIPPGDMHSDMPGRIADWCRGHDVPVPGGRVALALGNVLVQGRANGVLSGTLEDLRALIARTHPPVVHQPMGAAR